jgi:hypothetical protein
MKKQLYILVIIVLLAFLLAGCVPDDEASVVKSTTDDKVQDGKVQIVATLFPQYDFARQIAGDKAEVTLLLPPGMESHSYEPTPSDIIKINESDLFIYTGKNMEIWSQKIIDGMKSSNSKSLVLDLSEGIDLVSTEPTVAVHEKNKEARGVHNGGAGHDHDYETWDEHNNELIEAKGKNATNKEAEELTVLEVAYEMYARGYEFYPAKLGKSHEIRFLPEDGKVRLPFSALSGVGENAARALVTEYAKKPFLSIDDMSSRAKLNKTAIKALTEHGVLSELPESDQLSLF